jgi:hypothetical protein
MAFKASKGKSGLFEIHGVEAFIEKKFAELKKALGITAKSAPSSNASSSNASSSNASSKKPAAKPAKKASAKKPATLVARDPLAEVLSALDSHSKKAALIKAGKQKDQLLRSLIPLYVARNVDVSSGVTSKFWARHGVAFAAPNVAKALREHVGYARRTAKGPQITPNGIKYVEQALSGKNKAA